MPAKPFRTRRKRASAERCLRPLGATIDIVPPLCEGIKWFPREGYCRMEVYEKTIWISRGVLGFIALRELLGFQRIRYYGVQATKTFAKIKGLIQEALAKVRGIVKGAIKIIAAQSYRERYRQSSGRDPLRCPHCHDEMDVWKVWHPKYGVVYDELEAMRRGRYASTGRSAAG